MVDADGLCVEVVFEEAEVVRSGESVEAVGESVVVKEDGQDGFAKQGREGVLELGGPGTDVVEAVIALGKQGKEPNGQDFARSKGTLPVGRSWEVSVQIGRQIQTQKDGPQDGQVGHHFHTHHTRFAAVHPSTLRTPTYSEYPLQNKRTRRYQRVAREIEHVRELYPLARLTA